LIKIAKAKGVGNVADAVVSEAGRGVLATKVIRRQTMADTPSRHEGHEDDAD
jgi:hypothetical protein